LFLDATFISVRPSGPKEGVLVAWGFTEDGERVLLEVMLGMRESYEDWQALGRDLIARGLGAPMLIVADGAPGLNKAIEQCWPASDRQRCCVHRVRNLYAKLPERERERVKHSYWQALDDAINERDAKHRLQALVAELDKGATRPRRSAWPTIWTRSSCTCATRSATAAGGGQRTCSSDRSARSSDAPR
jgi:putative transposase